ncbi:MAG: SusC/RagA family TonB-linked outer membrane protein [Bacteroidales bacterium]|nr:SusC/RagA family TonB-linked outer membrane protein [Bacteroidales bacterium]
MKAYILTLLAAASMVQVSAQSEGSMIEGYVLDPATQTGLQGVTVKTGEVQVISDAKGHYRLKGQHGSVELQFSYDGRLDYSLVVSVQADSTHVQNIYMYENLFSPASAQHESYTNTASVSLSDVLSTQLANDVRAIGRSGQYGIGANLFINGYNSLNTNAQPLIVIDGVVMEEFPGETSVMGGYQTNRLLDIDVADIDHIEVLKDASSLYGSKGGNGVILVYTKRGITNQTRITLDASVSVKQQPHLPDVLSAEDFRTYVSEIYKNSAKGNSAASTFDDLFNDSKADKSYNANHNRTQWNDEVYQTGVFQRYALGIQGGDDVAKYNVSVGYLTGDEVMKESDFQRINTRVNADIKLTKWFDLGAEVYFTRVERELRDDGADAIGAPAFVAQIKSPFYHPYSYTDDGSEVTQNLSGVDALGITNPLALIENAKGKHKQYRFSINATPTFTIGPDWNVKAQFAYYQDNTNEHYFRPMNGVTPVVIENVGTSHNVVKEQNIRQTSIYANLEADYHHTFADIHKLNASVGDRLYINKYKSTYGEGHNTGDDQIYNLSTSLDFLQSGGYDLEWRSTSLYLQAEYVLAQKYKLWTVLTADASTRFGAEAADSFKAFGARWAFFPSAGLRWDAKGERFLSDVEWLDALSLRASIGQSGNDAIEALASQSYLSPVNYVGVATGHVIGHLSNESLKWEVTTKRNAGLDLAVWQNRIAMGVDFYKNTTDDLLIYRRNSTFAGLGSYLANGGSLENKGVEFHLDVKALDLKPFKWNLSLQLAHYKNEITDLADGEFVTDLFDGHILSRKGQAAGVFYGYRTQGVFATTAEAETAHLKVRNADTSLSSFTAGDVHFLEPNAAFADGIIDENDMTVIGDPNPDFTGSFSSNMQWKRFTLDVHCTFAVGGDIYNYQRSLLEGMSTFRNQSRAVLNRWKSEGQLTSMPKSSYGDPMGNSRFSDRWIEDGSYFKIRNVRLTYKLPIDNPYIEGLSVWGSVDNLVTFTKYLGADPETSCGGSVLTQGIDYGLMPACRTFSIGVKLNL